MAWNKVRSLVPADGAAERLYQIVAGPSEYKNWAMDYFEVSVHLQSVCAVFGHVPMSEALILALIPRLTSVLRCVRLLKLATRVT